MSDAVPVPAPTAWNAANVVTALRIVVVPFFVAALLVDDGRSVQWRLVAAALFALAAASDRLDGWLARRSGQVTDLGKLLDPIADKLLMGAALVVLSAYGEIWWWVTVVILVRELGITVMRFFLLRYVVLPASRGGKLKTVLQSVGIGLYVLPLWAMPVGFTWCAAAVLGAAVVVTVVTGVDYVRTAVVIRRTAAHPPVAGL